MNEFFDIEDVEEVMRKKFTYLVECADKMGDEAYMDIDSQLLVGLALVEINRTLRRHDVD